MANPLVWYIGAGTRIVCGRGTGRHVSMNGVPSTGSTIAGRSLRITFGVPVEPLLQMPLTCGDTASGRSGTSRLAVASIQAMSSAPEVDAGGDHVADAGLLPVGQVPAHRHGHRAELPRRQCAQRELRRVADAERQPVAEAQAAVRERTGQLAGPPVEVAPGQPLLAAVGSDVAAHLVVGALVGELADTAGEADLCCHLRPPPARPDVEVAVLAQVRQDT